MAVTAPLLIERAIRWHGPRVAIIDGERSLTFRETGDRTARLANVLRGLVSGPGRCVAVLLPNRLEAVEADLAIARAGLVKAPINARLVAAERRHVLANTAAEVLITERSEADAIMELLPELEHLRTVLCCDGGPAGTLDYETALSAAAATAPAPVVRPGDPSVVLHTSGTTGKPKGATWTDGSRVAAMRNMLLEECPVEPGDGIVHAGSLAHGSGSKVLAYFARGGRNIVTGRFEPEPFARLVERHRATSTFLVPTMIRMLLDAQDPPDGRLAPLRTITYGGAPAPRELLDRALATLGGVFVQVYGSCEAPHPVTVLPRELHRLDGDDGAHLASAGREVTAIELRIADDQGDDVPDDGVGELLVRGPSVMAGYWGDPEATAEVMTGDGWYRTGDVGRRDEQGYVYIVDRKRDMIISGGLNVYPAEVEAAIHRHPAVREASVVGLPDERWGERVAAFVVRGDGDGLTADELVEHCRLHLAGYKKPTVVEFVDALPKGATGKVLKDVLSREHRAREEGR